MVFPINHSGSRNVRWKLRFSEVCICEVWCRGAWGVGGELTHLLTLQKEKGDRDRGREGREGHEHKKSKKKNKDKTKKHERSKEKREKEHSAEREERRKEKKRKKEERKSGKKVYGMGWGRLVCKSLWVVSEIDM